MAEGEIRYDYWQKERVFVRPVQGKYSELFNKLYTQPRVFKSKKIRSTGGPVNFNKFVISPQITSAPIATQAIETHIITLAPGGKSQKHGHMNSAIVYVLEGRGYDIHDGVRLDWQAGDAYIIRNGCVHQHFNSDPNHPVRALIMKSKPLFMFFNLIFQRTVEWPPDKASPGWEGWNPDAESAREQAEKV